MVLVGMHPVLTQVPPKSPRSMIATFIPAAVRRSGQGRAGLSGTDNDGVVRDAHGLIPRTWGSSHYHHFGSLFWDRAVWPVGLPREAAYVRIHRRGTGAEDSLDRRRSAGDQSASAQNSANPTRGPILRHLPQPAPEDRGTDAGHVDLAKIPADAETWEKVIVKLRTGAMPPAGMPRPDAAASAERSFPRSRRGSIAPRKPSPTPAVPCSTA